MLDDWLERKLREPPERRAKRQLRDLNAVTRTTVKALAKHPNEHVAADILHTHTVRVAAITRRGTKPAPQHCTVCGKLLPGPPGNLWTNNPGIALVWAILIAFLVVILSQFIDWWALVVFPIGWLVSQSFVWSIPLPFLILLVLSFFL